MKIKLFFEKLLIKIIDKFFHNQIEILEKIIKNDDYDQFVFLIEKKGFSLYSENNLNENLVHLSVKYNNLRILNYLKIKIKKTEVFEFKNIYGDTPLIQAAINNNFIIAKFLIEICKANVHVEENEGYNLFLIACGTGCLELVQYLNEKHSSLVSWKLKNKQNGFHRAAYYNNNSVINYLFHNTKKIKIDSKDKEGNTPMHLAAYNFNISTCRLIDNLFKQKSNQDNKLYKIENNDKITPFDIIKNQIKRIREYEEKKSIELKNELVWDYLNNKEIKTFKLSSKTKKLLNKL